MKMIELCGGPSDGLTWRIERGETLVIVPIQILNPLERDGFSPPHYRRAAYVPRDGERKRFDFQGYDE